ncbi:hypothetical protein BAUCODRAFT_344323 [Baudoinia panamericana UAMH 10762]|uniref:Uncharacterized protein n=1 Tax=Baudoinia panamericana (strain UAMH 10762) TaxID=717646 RepID=M2N6E7_BAUPA|nr:uncharacterized protein BAUCODRAFT_344323 [Baudoinia panamericana UAMH 10762]EMC99643.1 hypothetical protein BAUCODRAFT_344323 [Baudoinia panamericana UAMH 10762]
MSQVQATRQTTITVAKSQKPDLRFQHHAESVTSHTSPARSTATVTSSPHAVNDPHQCLPTITCCEAVMGRDDYDDFCEPANTGHMDERLVQANRHDLTHQRTCAKAHLTSKPHYDWAR